MIFNSKKTADFEVVRPKYEALIKASGDAEAMARGLLATAKALEALTEVLANGCEDDQIDEQQIWHLSQMLRTGLENLCEDRFDDIQTNAFDIIEMGGRS